MKGFLERVKSLDLMEALDKEDMWEKITDDVEYTEAITILARWSGKFVICDPFSQNGT